MSNLNIDKVFKKHSFNSRLLLKEMDKRGISLLSLRDTYIVLAEYKNHKEKFYDIYSNAFSYTKGILIDDKYYSKKYLKKNSFSINSGEVFDNHHIKEAVLYAKKIGFPIVLKPTMSSHGDHVVMDIKNEQELIKEIKKFISIYKRKIYYLIEEQFTVNEYRLFITKNDFFAAVSRAPASIKGNGKNSIKELIVSENHRRMNPRDTCLCLIAKDSVCRNFLKSQKLTFNSILPKNKVVYLRKNSNVSTGGNCVDITDLVHEKYIKIAKRIIKKLNVPFIGIDLLTEDISKSGRYAICELNSSPGLSLHMMPERGRSRNVAAAIVDEIFPETKK